MGTITVGWGGSWRDVNESTPDDSDFVQSHILPLEGETTATIEFGLTDLTDPVESEGHIVRYRYRKSSSGGVTLDLRARLLEGTTEIGSWTVSDIPDEWTQGENTLTTTEADSITDYTDLRLEFRFSQSGSGNARSGLISWAELEAPSP